MQWLAERQVAHNVKGRKVIHINHVEGAIWIFSYNLAELVNQQVDIPLEERFLLLERLVGKGVREDSTGPGMPHVICGQNRIYTVQSWSVKHARLGWSGSASGPMAVDILPALRIVIAQLVRCHAHHLPVLPVQFTGPSHSLSC